jgi:tetratricopeptide (TPR) repeat protein
MDCGKKQKIPPGTIGIIMEKEPRFFFENEIRCKYCKSEKMELDYMERTGILLFSISNQNNNPGEEIITVNEKTIVEETKKMGWNEAFTYLEKKYLENPGNWETSLRYANSLQKQGKTNKAIKIFEETKKLNPDCISAYANLGLIHYNRYKTYKEKESKQPAIENLAKAEELLKSKQGNTTTIHDKMQVLLKIINALSELTKRNLHIEGFSKEEINQPLINYVAPDKQMTPITDLAEYTEILFPIETTIQNHWENNPELEDKEIIETLTNLKTNFDAPQNELGEEIKKTLKMTLLMLQKQNPQRKYSFGEIKSCITQIKNIAKQHESPDKIGYLQWVKLFFEDKLPETKEEIQEYIQNEES